MSIDKPIFALDGGKPGIPPNGKPNGKDLGKYLLAGPDGPPGSNTSNNQTIELNFTGTPGTASALYYSLVFQLPKWGFNVIKADEWIEVSPTHQEYYQRTISTKKQLEGIIKEGLASATAAVADYELLKHDLRKYEDILNYFNEEDEHSLKAMFIDQVDVHTGEGISMRSIAPRWPTLISDFMKLTDEDIEVDKIAKKLNISRAEAVILSTKNRLYKVWKKKILDVARERYSLIYGLVKSREKTITEYKNWLKPYISRFKMTVLGGERSEVRSKTLKAYADITGQATFANGIRIFAWKVLKTAEIRKPLKEVKPSGFVIDPYDSYVREKFILNKETGLAAIYPWLLTELDYCQKCKKFYGAGIEKCPICGERTVKMTEADKIVMKEILPEWKASKMNLDPTESYYMFFDFDISRVGSRLPIGELEDITFDIRAYTVSHNVLLVKILEIKCREKEIEKYIDEILGIKFGESDALEIAKKRYPKAFEVEEKEKTELENFSDELHKIGEEFSGAFKKISIPKTQLMFSKPGPYESHFKDRITKNYLKLTGGVFAQIKDFLIEKMGVR